MRDITLEDTFEHDFTTLSFSTGVPTTLAGSPVLSVKEGANATPITAGVSLAVDTASVTGMHEATIVATAANGFEDGKSYSIYISTGTVASVSVVGVVVGKFTVGLSAAAVIVNDPTFGNSALNDSISNIAPGVSGGGAVNASGATITTGTPTLTYTATQAQDGILHEIAAAAGNTDFEYTVTLGPNESVTDVFWRGYIQSNGDTVELQFYSWVTMGFVTELELPGSNGTTLFNETIPAITAYTGTGADIGKIRFRFLSTTTTNIATDRLRFEFTTNFQSAGYANGQIWVKTVGGEAGTAPYRNGVVERPVLTWADAVTLSTTISDVDMTDFHVINGSTILLTANSDNYSIFGDNWTLGLAGRSAAGAYFQGAHVSGIGLAATDEMHFEGCEVATASVQSGHFDFCSFGATVTHTLAGDYNYHNCYSNVEGAGGPTFTKTAGQVITQQWRDWKGSITVSGIQASDVMTISGTELGDVVLNGVDGTVKIIGMYESLNDNRTGSPVLINAAFKRSDVTALQTDWANGGRLDLILDARMAEASINTTAGAIDDVTLVATTTINTDMRGTDSGATAAALAIVDSKIDDLAVKKNTAFSNFEFLMVLASDHVTPATGLTVTAQRSIDGAAFASVSGAIAEVSNGIYQFDALAADTNGDLITWRFSAATADDTFVTFKTVA